MQEDTPGTQETERAPWWADPQMVNLVLGVALNVAILVYYTRKTDIDHLAWRLRHWRKRRARAEETAMQEVRRDISRLEHGEAG